MVRTNEGGSVLSFVIVGAVLAATFVGAAYGIRQLSQPGDVMPIAKTDETNKQEAPKSEEQQKEEQKAQNSAPKNDPKPQQPAAPAQPKQPAIPQTSTAPKTQLPKTGPADSFVVVLALGLLTLSATAYAQSRRLKTTS